MSASMEAASSLGRVERMEEIPYEKNKHTELIPRHTVEMNTLWRTQYIHHIRKIGKMMRHFHRFLPSRTFLNQSLIRSTSGGRALRASCSRWVNNACGDATPSSKDKNPSYSLLCFSFKNHVSYRWHMLESLDRLPPLSDCQAWISASLRRKVEKIRPACSLVNVANLWSWDLANSFDKLLATNGISGNRSTISDHFIAFNAERVFLFMIFKTPMVEIDSFWSLVKSTSNPAVQLSPRRALRDPLTAARYFMKRRSRHCALGASIATLTSPEWKGLAPKQHQILSSHAPSKRTEMGNLSPDFPCRTNKRWRKAKPCDMQIQTECNENEIGSSLVDKIQVQHASKEMQKGSEDSPFGCIVQQKMCSSQQLSLCPFVKQSDRGRSHDRLQFRRMFACTAQA